MTQQVSMIAATASQVAVAYVAHVAAGEALSSVKFDAVMTMAATVAMRLRVEYLNEGNNLETNNKGELLAVRDLSKEQRDAFVAAFIKAGVGEKDAANIASMGRTIARRFVPPMVENGFLRIAKSGDEMRESIEIELMEITGGRASYNELEKARARGWQAAEEEAAEEATQDDASDGDDTAASKADVDLSATLDTAPEPQALTASDALDDEVSKALQALRAAVQRDDWERLNAAGFGSFLNEAKEAHKAFMEANAEAEKALAHG